MDQEGASVYLSLNASPALSSQIASLLLIKVLSDSHQMDSERAAAEQLMLLLLCTVNLIEADLSADALPLG